jgi:hypothetical protein
MRCLNNSEVAGFTAKAADLASPQYTERVAAPVMQAVDAMPKPFRELVNYYGYVDVYRAWRKGWSPDRIRAAAVNGAFRLP